MRDSVDGLTTKVRSNSIKLTSYGVRIEQHETEINDIRAEVSRLGNAQAKFKRSLEEVGPAQIDDSAKRREFDLCRRSLRLWPIPGNHDEEMKKQTCVFIRNTLGLPSDVINSDCFEKIFRPSTASGFFVRNEVVVRFTDVAARDTVMGSSSKLSTCFDGERRPTARIRIEVPKFLTGTFGLLRKYGETLRGRHGEGTKRHVKFDDSFLTLYLNVKLPGELRWTRVSDDFARKSLKEWDKRSSSDMDRRLNNFSFNRSSTPRDRLRAGSVGDEQMHSARSWRGQRPRSEADMEEI